MAGDQSQPIDVELMHEKVRGLEARTGELESLLVQRAAELVAQEHRTFRVFRNFFTRKEYSKDDPRRKAAVDCLIWYCVRVLVPAGVIAVGVSAAVLTTLLALEANLLLEQQNRLIVSQNRKIDIQNELSEASRRAGLLFELSSILDQVRDEARDQPHDERSKIWPLSADLRGRVIALTRGLRPYRFLESPGSADDEVVADASSDSSGNEGGLFYRLWYVLSRKSGTHAGKSSGLTSVALSPERAQILISLFESRVSLSEIVAAGDFTFSDLRKADLQDVVVDDGLFDHASFQDANLIDASLKFASLRSADLRNALLKGSDLSNADLTNADLKGADLRDATVEKANFTDANLEGVKVSTQEWFESARNSARNLDEWSATVIVEDGRRSILLSRQSER